jgi:hypothetical protein
MAAPTEPTGSPIEALFRPSTRFRDLYPNSDLPEGFTEVELLPGLTIENGLATGVTWEDFQRFLDGKIVWMTPDVCICSNHVSGSESIFWLGGDGGTNMCVRVRSGTPPAAATVTCNFLLRLLATCEHHGVSITGLDRSVSPPLSGAALSLFF